MTDAVVESAVEGLENWEYPVGGGSFLRGQRTPPSGKPVIHFLHGNGFCCLSYWPFLRQFVSEFDLFLHDIQGHGDSDNGDQFLGWNENADIVHRVWQHFQGDYRDVPVWGVGHSMGGVLTALMAVKQPEPFAGLVLLDPVLFPPAMLLAMQLFKFLHLKSPNPLVEKALRRRNGWTSRSEAKLDLEGKGMFTGWTEASLNAYINHALYEQGSADFRLKCTPQREAEIFSSFPRELWSTLAKISQPTALLYGDQSYPFVKKSVRILLVRNERVVSQQLQGGHCFMQEYPMVAAHEVIRMIAELT